MKTAISVCLLAVSLAVLSSVVRAELTIRGEGRTATGVTDNVNSRPNGEADGYLEIEPRLMLGLSSGRAFYQLGLATLSTIYFVETDQTAPIAVRSDLLGLFLLTDNLRLRLDGLFSVTPQNATTLSDPTNPSVGTQPGGSAFSVNAQVRQGIDWALSEFWTLRQGASFGAFVPINNPTLPTTFNADASLGIVREWEWTQLGLEVTHGFTTSDDFTPVDADGNALRLFEVSGNDLVLDSQGNPAPLDVNGDPRLDPQAPVPLMELRLPGQNLMRTQAMLQLSQRLGQYWSFTLAAGGLRAADAGNASHQIFHPSGRLTVRVGDLWSIELSAEHTIRQSLFVSDTYLLEELRLRGQIPLGAPLAARWLLSFGAGYDQGRPIDLETKTIKDEVVHVVSADVALLWRFNPYMEFSLRYQFSWQNEVPIEAAVLRDNTPDAAPNNVFIPDGFFVPNYRRSLVMFSAIFRYPGGRDRGIPLRGRREVGEQQWQQLFNRGGPPPTLPPAAPRSLEAGEAQDPR